MNGKMKLACMQAQMDIIKLFQNRRKNYRMSNEENIEAVIQELQGYEPISSRQSKRVLVPKRKKQ